MLRCIADGLADHLLMAEVHTVEHSNGQTNLAPGRLKLFGGVDDLHGLSHLARERQKWNNPPLKFGGRKVQDLLVRDRILHVILAGALPAQASKVCPASDLLAKF